MTLVILRIVASGGGGGVCSRRPRLPGSFQDTGRRRPRNVRWFCSARQQQRRHPSSPSSCSSRRSSSSSPRPSNHPSGRPRSTSWAAVLDHTRRRRTPTPAPPLNAGGWWSVRTSTTAVRQVLHGGTLVLGSTLISCWLAVQVEATAHAFLFWCRPHWYNQHNNHNHNEPPTDEDHDDDEDTKSTKDEHQASPPNGPEKTPELSHHHHHHHH